MTVELSGLSRRELALTVCENLGWQASNGHLRVQACLEWLELLCADGLVNLPPKRASMARTNAPVRRAEALRPPEVAAALAALAPVTVDPVASDEQALFDATMAKHHPLGFRRPFGASIRYWIHGQWRGKTVVLGAMVYGAAARHVAVRDRWLGWTPLEQRRHRHRIVAQSRFLILPGVRVAHLASHVLALSLHRLRPDWQARFGYAPVLVETFVTPPHRGTCYQAANFLHLGQTTGLGRQDRRYDQGGTVREVFAYPLVRAVQRALVSDEAQPSSMRPGHLQGGDSAMITAQEQLNAMADQHLQKRYEMLLPFLDEKQRRLLAGAEAIVCGEGGRRHVARLLGVSEAMVGRGVDELIHPETIEQRRVRKPGGGRKPTVATDPDLVSDLERLVSPTTRGDPQSPLRWTLKSTRRLATELNAMKPGRAVSNDLVRGLLHEMGYSLMANRKTKEGKQHPDRDAQFRHLNAMVEHYQRRGQPVISVDTKKKELIGEFKNAGREWYPQGEPVEVNVHDFPDAELGKVAPYGVYDPTRNEGWVNVGIDHDTAAFAVASIRGWWQTMGKEAYPDAKRVLITADGGGSNSARSRLWKLELQKLADETGLRIAICHFPPGTSKWNKVEHRLFAHITQNWRGRPLETHELVVNLIANTTTQAGLKVRCQLDTSQYPTGVRVSDTEMAAVRFRPAKFHGEWNYFIQPRVPK